MKRVPLLVIITPRACARGKVISSVVIVVVGVVVIVISTKIAKSQKKAGVGQSAQCLQMVESHEKLFHLL